MPSSQLTYQACCTPRAVGRPDAAVAVDRDDPGTRATRDSGQRAPRARHRRVNTRQPRCGTTRRSTAAAIVSGRRLRRVEAGVVAPPVVHPERGLDETAPATLPAALALQQRRHVAVQAHPHHRDVVERGIDLGGRMPGRRHPDQVPAPRQRGDRVEEATVQLRRPVPPDQVRLVDRSHHRLVEHDPRNLAAGGQCGQHRRLPGSGRPVDDDDPPTVDTVEAGRSTEQREVVDRPPVIGEVDDPVLVAGCRHDGVDAPLVDAVPLHHRAAGAERGQLGGAPRRRPPGAWPRARGRR